MRFLAFRTIGMPAQVVQRIRAAAQKLHLTSHIPLVKLQRNPPREFYLFLGIKCDDPHELPPTFATFCTLTRLSQPLRETLSKEEIAGIVGRADIETHGLNALPYKPYRAPDPGDPFDTLELSADATDADLEQGMRGERLLNWMSVAGRGSWQTFVSACDALALTGAAFTPRVLLGQMALLGHAELSPDGRQWCVAPGSVVECAADAALRFLAGARTPKTVSGSSIAFDLQPGSCAPARARLSGVKAPLGLTAAGTASVRLATILPDLEGWKASLPRLDRVNAMIGRVERWDGKRFVEDRAFVEKPGRHQSPSGLYRLIRGVGETARRFIAFFDARAERWLQGDWHGLAFLALQEQGAAVAGHDPARSRLLIPRSDRWPLLYEKGLVLAGGLLPSRCGAHAQWLCYEAIPAALAHQLAEKLNVPLEKLRHV